MTKQEHRHILFLAYDLLVDANISSLPVDLYLIAALYNMVEILNKSKSRYENAVVLSQNILMMFGYKHNLHYSEFLAVRILSPMVIMKEINISSAKEISELFEIPIEVANNRFKCYRNYISPNIFNVTSLEAYILAQCSDWISNYHLHPLSVSDNI